MPSDRIQRRIDRILDDAEAAADRKEWSAVADLAREVLALDPDNEDAPALLRAAEANLGAAPALDAAPAADSLASPAPESFAAGRYQVRKFLGEGGRKERRDKPA